MLQGVSWHRWREKSRLRGDEASSRKIKPDWEKMEMKAVILPFSGKLRKGNIISYSPYFFQLLRTWPKKAMRKTIPLWRIKTEIQKQIVVRAGIFFCQQQQRESEEEKDRKSLVFFFLRDFSAFFLGPLTGLSRSRKIINIWQKREGKGESGKEEMKKRKKERGEIAYFPRAKRGESGRVVILTLPN